MKTFIEEYGLIVVAAIVIMLFVVVATPVGKALGDGVMNITKGFTQEIQEGFDKVQEEDKELNSAGFYFNETYSIYDTGSGILPEGENSFVFKDDGTVDWYVDGNLMQTLPYEADENGFSVPDMGVSLSGNDNGKNVTVNEYGSTLKQGESVVTKGDWTYYFSGWAVGSETINGWCVKYTGSDPNVNIFAYNYELEENRTVEGYPVIGYWNDWSQDGEWMPEQWGPEWWEDLI